MKLYEVSKRVLRTVPLVLAAMIVATAIYPILTTYGETGARAKDLSAASAITVLPSMAEGCIPVEDGIEVEGGCSKVLLDLGSTRFESGECWIESTLIDPKIKFTASSLSDKAYWDSEDVTVEFEYLDTRLKETIVIDSSAITSLSYRIKTNGELELQEDGSLTVLLRGLPYISIEAPTANDSYKKELEAAYHLEDDVLTLLFTKPPTEDQYPIVIDPSYSVYTVTSSNSIKETNSRHIVRLSDGTLVVAYLYDDPEEVHVIYSYDEGETWEDEETINSDGFDKQLSGIVRDDDDNIYVYWEDIDRDGIYGIMGSGDPISWGSTETCVDRSYVDEQPSMSFDSSGNIHMAWRAYYTSEADYDIAYLYRDASTGWQTATSLVVLEHISSYDQYNPTIVVDEEDDLHVAWWGYGTAPAASKACIKYIKRTGASWGSVDQIAYSSSYDQWYVSLMVDSSEYPHVSWYGKGWGAPTTYYRVMYSEKTGGSWATPTVITAVSNDNLYPTITRTTTDDIIIAWFGKGYGVNSSTYNIKAKIYSSGAWGSVINVTDEATTQLNVQSLFHIWGEGQIPVTGFALIYIDYTTPASPIIKFYKSDDLSFAAAPIVTSVDPSEGSRYETLTDVEIVGDNFTGTISVSFGAGISVDDYSVDTDELITCDITIASDATIGNRDVSVTNGDGTGILVDGFSVTAKPTVTLVDPSEGSRYESLTDVEVAGTNFTGTISVGFGTGITVDDYSIDSDILITCDITISASAPLGGHDVTVTNGYGSGTLTAGFTVIAGYPGAPLDFMLEKQYATQVVITWTTNPEGDSTMVRRKVGDYPSSRTDGTEVYNGALETCTDTDLQLDEETYYYRAWTYDSAGVLWSTDYAEDNIGGRQMLFIGLIGLAGFLTFMCLRYKFLPLSLSASLAWLALGVLLLLDPDTIGFGEITDTWVTILGFVFVLMTFVPLALQMRADIRYEARGKNNALSWSAMETPPKDTRPRRTRVQEDYRQRLGGLKRAPRPRKNKWGE